MSAAKEAVAPELSNDTDAPVAEPAAAVVDAAGDTSPAQESTNGSGATQSAKPTDESSDAGDSSAKADDASESVAQTAAATEETQGDTTLENSADGENAKDDSVEVTAATESSETASDEAVGDADEESAEATEAAQSDDEASHEGGGAGAAGDSDAATLPKTGLVGKVLNNYKVITACMVSVAVGFLGSMVIPSAEPEVEEEVAVVVEKPRFVAAISRRNEAIRPLVPFDDLDEQVVELGEKLFHDPALSGNGRISCASCHVIAEGGDDGKALAEGYEHSLGEKNTPTVLNSAYNFVQFWDGRVETLEEQIDGPLLSPIEMNSDWGRILKYLKSNKLYLTAFQEHLGGEPNEQRVREALATYERSLVTPNSTFDKWLAGDEKALNGDEYAGYFLFKKMNCMGCHNGPGAGGNSFEKLGKFKTYFTEANPGRESDLGRFLITGEEKDRYVFRVPPLRNVELTGPYFHDGSIDTLDEAVRLMIEHQVGLEATDQSVKRIVAFLKTLTGEIPQ